jgi:hypothetical protein
MFAVNAIANVGISSPFEQEIESFIQNLNKRFDKQVTFVSNCSELEPSNKIDSSGASVSFCRPALDWFSKLRPKERPLEAVLTIVGHEYSHLLLDSDLSEAAKSGWAEAKQKHAEFILARLTERQHLQLKQVRMVNETDIQLIKKMLNLAHHENMDSLSVKLMILEGLSPNENMVELFSRNFQEPQFERFIEPRIRVAKKALSDGLESWSNFKCSGIPYSLDESNLSLKRGLPSSLIAELLQQCTDEEALKVFNQTLDDYYP